MKRYPFFLTLLVFTFLLLAACDSGNSPSIESIVRFWSTAEQIDTENVGGARGPKLAMDSTGNAVAVWHQYDATSSSVWANYYDGSSWGTAERICIEDDASAMYPEIAMDSTGLAIAVWKQEQDFWANYYDGSSWSTAQLLDTGEEYVCGYKIAMDQAGNAVVVLEQSTGSLNSIWAMSFNGSSWSTAEQISTNNSVNAQKPKIAMDSDGHLLVVWQQYSGADSIWDIWANSYDGSSWGSAEQLDTSDSGLGGYQIAIDPDGNGLALWSSSGHIWSNYFNGSTWGTPEWLSTDETIDAYGPELTMDSSGHALAVWGQNDDSTSTSTFWTSSFNGSSWDAEKLIELDAEPFTYPQLYMDSSGDALMVWGTYDDTDANQHSFTYWANYYNGSSWGSEVNIFDEEIEVNDYIDIGTFDITFNSSGDVLAVWSMFDGTIKNIMANRFE